MTVRVIQACVPGIRNLLNSSREEVIKMSETHYWMIIIKQPMYHHYYMPGLSNLLHAGSMQPISWFSAAQQSIPPKNVLMLSSSLKKGNISCQKIHENCFLIFCVIIQLISHEPLTNYFIKYGIKHGSMNYVISTQPSNFSGWFLATKELAALFVASLHAQHGCLAWLFGLKTVFCYRKKFILHDWAHSGLKLDSPLIGKTICRCRYSETWKLKWSRGYQ
jgi:hypothetical protein